MKVMHQKQFLLRLTSLICVKAALDSLSLFGERRNCSSQKRPAWKKSIPAGLYVFHDILLLHKNLRMVFRIFDHSLAHCFGCYKHGLFTDLELRMVVRICFFPIRVACSCEEECSFYDTLRDRVTVSISTSPSWSFIDYVKISNYIA
jgi:hypothetical protein